MADAKEYIKLWLSYESYFTAYDDAAIGALVRAMLRYRQTGQEPDFDGPERFIWPAIKLDIDQQIDAQARTSEARSRAGQSGGRPSETGKAKKANAFSEKQKKQMLFEESKKSYVQGQGQGQIQGQSTPPTPPGGFERFWELYPRKVGKQAALKAWSRLKPSAELTKAILDAVEYQKNSREWTKDGGQYIPHPTTWLNQGRWEDETEEKKHGNSENAGASHPRWNLRNELDSPED